MPPVLKATTTTTPKPAPPVTYLPPKPTQCPTGENGRVLLLKFANRWDIVKI